MNMIIVGITGGSGSGKTTLVEKLINGIPQGMVKVLSQDAYYWDRGHISKEERLKINFDHPDSIEWDLLIGHIENLRQGNHVEMPRYDYATSSRMNETIHLQPSKLLIVEGLLIFTNKSVRQMLDLKVFVDTSPSERLKRIIERDTIFCGRTIEMALRHYETYVKPMHDLFIEPAKLHADVVIPDGGLNLPAVGLLIDRINELILKEH